MTPKERAEYLTRALYSEAYDTLPCVSTNVLQSLIKECALISIHEIMGRDKDGELQYDDFGDFNYEGFEYWEEVKQEINNL